jgi:hypothetical protein
VAYAHAQWNPPTPRADAPPRGARAWDALMRELDRVDPGFRE